MFSNKSHVIQRFSLVNESTMLCEDFTEVVTLFTGFIEIAKATG